MSDTPNITDAAREAAKRLLVKSPLTPETIAEMVPFNADIIQRAIDSVTAELRGQLKDAGQRGALLALDAYKSDLAAKDREIAELRRINMADYTEAGWQRAREVVAERAAAQEDSKRLDWLEAHFVGFTLNNATLRGTPIRAAIDAARKESAK